MSPSHRFIRQAQSLAALLAAALGSALHAAAPAAAAGTPPAAASSGTGWQQAGWGGGGYFYAAAHHPTRDGVIYMGGDVGGAYKTEDHGRTWRFINQGLAGYGVFSLAVDRSNPETVYAATEDGLCKSTDGGEHWRTLPQTGRKELRLTGEKKRSIRSVAVDPNHGNVVYAASPAGKVYKSTDGGETWTLSYEKKSAEETDGSLRIQYGKVNGEYYGDIVVPVVFPAGADGCSGIGFTLKGDGSQPKDSFLILRTADGLIHRSKNLNTLYRETEWHDVVLNAADFSLDPDYLKRHPEAAAGPYAGPNWSAATRLDLACSGALPTQATVLKITRFFFAATAPAAGGNAPAAQPRLITFRDFRTDKTLQVFGNLHLGAPTAGPVYSVVVAKTNSARVLAATHDAGLVLSEDAGRTWRELGTPKRASNAAFDPANADVIYGTFFADGVWKSADAGKTWTRLPEGIDPKGEMFEVAVSPANPLHLYVIGTVGWKGLFYYSTDGGASWKGSTQIALDPDGNPSLENRTGSTVQLSAPTNLTLNPRNPNELFISANWRPCLSTDGGLTWTERDQGADISCVTDIRFHKGRIFVTAMDEGTLVSDNNGRSWRQLWPNRYIWDLSGHNWRVAVTDVNGAERILATVSPWGNPPPRLVRSEDGGKTSQVVRTGLPDYLIRPNTMWGQGHPRALAVDPNDPQTVYLGIDGDPAEGKSGGGIFKSADGGKSWTQLPNQPGSRRMFYGLAVDPTDSRRIFWGACGVNGGVWRSEDAGASWENVLRNENFVWNVLVTPDGTVYISGANLWKSADHGKTWTQLTKFPGTQRAVVAIEADPRDAKTLWISATTWNGSSDGGIFKTVDGGATWQEITGNIPFVKPHILRFNPETNELWAGWVGLYKIKQ